MDDGRRIAMALRGAYLYLHRSAEELFSSLETTADQFVILNLLAEQEGLTQAALVKASFSDPNTIRAILVPLERRGLVKRRPHPTDGRARCVFLTHAGRTLQARLESQADAFHRRLAKSVRVEDRAALLESLGRIAETMTPTRALINVSSADEPGS